MSNESLSFFLARLGIGSSMLGHGLVRLPKIAAFSEWMTQKFVDTLLPMVMVSVFARALPVIELLIGVSVMLGAFTRYGLVAGAVVMIVLIFGSCLIEEWAALPSQLIHLAFFVLLLVFLKENHYSIDRTLKMN